MAHAVGFANSLRSVRLGVIRVAVNNSGTYKALASFSPIRHFSKTKTLLDMAAQKGVRIIEVGPRDGLQNIAKAIPTAVKIELIERLRRTGLSSIEVTSAVSPKAIPQLADNQTLLSHSSIQSLINQPSTRMPVLVPNVRGLEIALKHGVKEVAVFVSATEGFSKANTNCTVEEGLRRAGEVAARAIKEGVQVRGYVDHAEGKYDERSLLN